MRKFLHRNPVNQPFIEISSERYPELVCPWNIAKSICIMHLPYEEHIPNMYYSNCMYIIASSDKCSCFLSVKQLTSDTVSLYIHFKLASHSTS